MKGRKGDFARLQHIYSAILEIEEYIQNRNFSDFSLNSMFRFACIKQLEIIGEASNHISLETQNEFSEIQWAQIVGMRNIFIHEYFGIDLYIAWEIIEFDIPELKTKIKEILDRMT
jgi:uncharacterized protein with HEPN domain